MTIPILCMDAACPRLLPSSLPKTLHTRKLYTPRFFKTLHFILDCGIIFKLVQLETMCHSNFKIHGGKWKFHEKLHNHTTDYRPIRQLRL